MPENDTHDLSQSVAKRHFYNVQLLMLHHLPLIAVCGEKLFRPPHDFARSFILSGVRPTIFAIERITTTVFARPDSAHWPINQAVIS